MNKKYLVFVLLFLLFKIYGCYMYYYMRDHGFYGSYVIKYNQIEGEKINIVDSGKEVAISGGYGLGGQGVYLTVKNNTNQDFEINVKDIIFQAEIFDSIQNVQIYVTYSADKRGVDSEKYYVKTMNSILIQSSDVREFEIRFIAVPKNSNDWKISDSSDIQFKIPQLNYPIQLKFSTKEMIEVLKHYDIMK